MAGGSPCSEADAAIRGFDRPDHAVRRRLLRDMLATLERHGVRRAVLGAFGCGAFRDPAREVARIDRDAIRECTGSFDRSVFAVFRPGYGPDDFTPFRGVLECA